MATDVIYREVFDDGPGIWKVGRNKATAEGEGTYHRNIFGHYGEGAALKWSATGGRFGGFATSDSPWYFDDNHGEWMWLHLIANTQTDFAGLDGIDLRGATVRVVLRGRDLELKGTRLFFRLQGWGGKKGYYTGEVLYNWALTSQPIDQVLTDGQWHEVNLTLDDDELRWSQIGLIKGPLIGRIKVLQSLTAADGCLEGVLAGKHRDFGFILGGINPLDHPAGCIDFDEIAVITARSDQD
jgi:hypothetical protein